ncbi:adenine deaminase [Caryophanon latum]|uniref:Adenine deaminase n=1 Tax=Caryophanon latum TaxID=33977 RepID=A0A1C0YVQ2_9BACL|nr:adenine deaminase [Caryophanon latum]OCS91222.1 adenine deaminase [Caryophanon latum]
MIKNLQQQIHASQTGKVELVLRNAKVADVFSRTWLDADVGITAGKIVAVDYTRSLVGKTERDVEGQYVVPGFIDGHIHIESSMLTPSEFSRILLPHGITSVVTDPHEIANVNGAEGIQFMLDDAAKADMDIFVMLPSSVPGTSLENAGAVLHAKDLAPFMTHESVLGLAEVMDYPAVLNGDETMLEKLLLARAHNLIIDGHGAGLQHMQIRGYRTAGIHTDHECVTADEARDRVTQGMYVLIREGSAAKNLRDVLAAVTDANAHRFAFCTDDKHLDELIEEGSINYAVQLAIEEGMDPLLAITLGTFNAAQCYRLYEKGAVAPGYDADIVVLPSLTTIAPIAVFKNGQLVAQNGELLVARTERVEPSVAITQSVRIPTVTNADLQIAFPVSNRANVIEIIPNQIMTKKLVTEVPVENGYFVPSVEQDLLKLAIVERHHNLGNIQAAIVKGFGLQSGAVATTVAHDSHNALVLGTNDDDMIVALEALQRMQGGFVIVNEGKVIGELALPVSGLMTLLDADEACEQLHALHDALHVIHPPIDFHLFLTLSFIALPVIPQLKITDIGLFDVDLFEHIAIQIDK